MIRRITLAADHADLAVLEDEARRRGISLAQLLRDVVAVEAARLRCERGPRTAAVGEIQNTRAFFPDPTDADRPRH